MEIAALVKNQPGQHEATVRTGDVAQPVHIAPKPKGGSALNGGELLMLAIATCYCNDLYREAQRLGIPLDGVEVEASAQFPGIGLAATDIRYSARIASTAPPEAIAELLRQTDAVAEIHNTLRAGAAVTLTSPSP
ncbi:OsmC family protein [Piscinibacter sp. XHJ-5]|uniref:OsmC family protein n=1 Tax=Piscinibacter sp. XHJ-5 TaxID=3037797 RepID=UPI0024533066|nr:OsmC family protein [Piscinibacter sp. XHJ-5]